MPPKIRQLKASLKKAGFISRSAKESHTFWEHLQFPDLMITISGHDGNDAEKYQVKDVQRILKELEGRR
jgi:predicted RNA binding protein YcfA (HicA-like mRNA interferase family)